MLLLLLAAPLLLPITAQLLPLASKRTKKKPKQLTNNIYYTLGRACAVCPVTLLHKHQLTLFWAKLRCVPNYANIRNHPTANIDPARTL